MLGCHWSGSRPRPITSYTISMHVNLFCCYALDSNQNSSNCGRIHVNQHSQLRIDDMLALQSWPSQFLCNCWPTWHLQEGSCDFQLGRWAADLRPAFQTASSTPSLPRKSKHGDPRRSRQVESGGKIPHHHYVLSVTISTAKQEGAMHPKPFPFTVYSDIFSISTKSILKPHHTEAHSTP